MKIAPAILFWIYGMLFTTLTTQLKTDPSTLAFSMKSLKQTPLIGLHFLSKNL